MKLERLISITYALLNNEVISASDLANKYQVSQRTIYRDIEAIGAAGIPVVSYQGVNGGFGIIEQYKMDKSLLRSEDIQSLITLLHSTSTVFKDNRAEETIDRLRTIQPEERNPALTMDFGSWRANNDILYTLRTAINDGTVVRMEYINSKSDKMTRIVEPVSLHFKYYSWYLQGYCRAREDYRVFKLSRITDLVTLRERSTRSHAEAPINFWSDNNQEQDIESAVLHFSGASLARALDIFYAENKHFNEDGTLTIKAMFNPTDADWLLATILGFGEEAVIQEPLMLKKLLKNKIEKMLNKYSEV
ncbi:YafY family transcriptional regulator [Cohnella sp. NL03-T5]|uniref:YafY family protein n=1 Tax=Cohnella silvisoli TaxID=2873699 RepID=A0ABV1L0P8_9BACL|nr:YafY family protein [Cohnella silvisoli]MCD9025361.1 YafY family transcriptional regulator [Cohnella silvisoli]